MPDPLERSLVDLLVDHAADHPERRAFIFLGEENVEQEILTYGELDRRARLLAADLLRTASPGDRAVLVFPSCLSFVVAFFACLHAGLIAVPMVPPRGRRLRDAVFSVARDCRPAVALTVSGYLDFTQSELGALPELADTRFVAVDAVDPSARPSFVPRRPDLDDIAFLQYTSGSTSAPKGVMVSHRNLLENLEMQRLAFDNDERSTYVGWAPLYHDMGLIANVLEPFYVGALCVLMAPATFAQRPWLWLKAISDYRARVSGGPNFAYDLCCERSERILRQPLDLACWEIAFNSAEPVRAETLERFAGRFAAAGFRREAFYPCYGMAEATLLISGGPPLRPPLVTSIGKTGLTRDRAEPPADASDALAAVGCGRPMAGEEVRIVVPDESRIAAAGEIGEIWVAGPHIPSGYWRNPQASAETFHAEVPALPGVRFLRTGDLGFMDQGQVFITGRLKDLMIIRGRNYYPQDVERIAEEAYPGLKRGSSAAFTLAGEAGEELVLVQEVERLARRSIDRRQAVIAMRRAVFDEFELTIGRVLLLSPGSIPKTSSGKIRRAETRRRMLAGTLELLPAAGAELELAQDGE